MQLTVVHDDLVVFPVSSKISDLVRDFVWHGKQNFCMSVILLLRIKE